MRSYRDTRCAVLYAAFALGHLGLGGCGAPEEAEAEVAESMQSLRRTPGAPLPGLTPEQRQLFQLGEAEFLRQMLPRDGLGPVFIERSCVACHFLGGVGGADSLRDPNHLVRRFGRIVDGAYDPLPALGGDVLQTRSLRGIQPGCDVSPEVVPPEAEFVAERNPLPLFGAGLIDAIPEMEILAGAVPRGDGVHGRPNLDAEGRPGRFGWKAQSNTLLQFTATAAQGALGLTSPLVPNEPRPQGQPIPAGCANEALGASSPNDVHGVVMFNLTAWQALLAPVQGRRRGWEEDYGRLVFESIGCAKCHTPTLRTGDYALVRPDGTRLPVAALSRKPVPLYSDLLLHDMGPELDERVVMRQARGSEFRTAPLWGLRLRERLLHDGRARTVDEAIRLHGGEAQIIRERYLRIAGWDRRALLRFLSTL